jgi:hypothetical protein
MDAKSTTNIFFVGQEGSGSQGCDGCIIKVFLLPTLQARDNVIKHFNSALMLSFDKLQCLVLAQIPRDTNTSTPRKFLSGVNTLSYLVAASTTK